MRGWEDLVLVGGVEPASHVPMASVVTGFVHRAHEHSDAYGERCQPPALTRERAVAAGSRRGGLSG